jgi:hypothetical protein
LKNTQFRLTEAYSERQIICRLTLKQRNTTICIPAKTEQQQEEEEKEKG